uniref:C2H2-type domain-containing protein n=1 Tax=Clastoptera arizonana TaxID=38151 RepID=A0A1B6C8F1_9HEMI
MEEPDEKLAHQYLVQMIQTSQSQQNFTDIQDDIHICGLCKQSFTDIHVFLQHKGECGLILETMPIDLVGSQVDYIVSDQSLFRISGLSLDPASIPIIIQSIDSTEKVSQNVRSNFVLNVPDQSLAKKDGIQIDVEDVASLLVNQLSKEVLNSPTAELSQNEENQQNIEQQLKSKPVNKNETKEPEKNVTPSNIYETTRLVSRKNKVACSICNFVSQHSRDLVRHMRRHTGEKPYECNVCNRRFARQDKLLTHKRTHTGEKPYRCNLCNYATTDSGPLRKHLRIHSDERPHKCQMCPYRARDSSQLTVHLRTHTGDCPFVCRIESCKRAFKTSSDLKRHNVVHAKNSSTHTKETSQTQVQGSGEQAESQIKYYPCSLASCDFIGTSLRDLRSHNKTHHEEGLFKTTTCDSASSKYKTKTFSCHICNSNYRHKRYLRSHLKKHQIPNGVMRPVCFKSHQCHLCSAAYVRSDSLRSHLRQHQQNDKILGEFDGKGVDCNATTNDCVSML